jgi:TPR repeat protein
MTHRLFFVLVLVAGLSACATQPGSVNQPSTTPQASALTPTDTATAAVGNELGQVPIDELQRRIAAGDTKALAELGSRYGTGNGVEKDYAKAIEVLRAAADKGEADAQFYIGTAYANGLGVPRDETLAVLWFELAAKQKHPAACYWLAVRIANGIGGISPNWEAAVPYLWTSAVSGYIPAEFLLGYAYQTGSGVDKNSQAAAYWYRRTLSREYNVRTHYNLRLLIERGEVEVQPGDPPPTVDQNG